MRDVRLQCQIFIILSWITVSMVYAGEPWIEKSWIDWTDRDIRKILTDSPWAHSAPVPYPPLRSGEDIEIDASPPALSVGHVPDYSPDKQAPASQLDSHPVFRPDQVFVIRWSSAKIIRKALLLKNESHRPSSTQLKELEGVPKEYLITVHSDPLNHLPLAYETRLMENSELSLRIGRIKVRPIRVIIRYVAESQDPDSFEFYFNHTDQTGRDLISPKEDQIDFKAQVGPRIFRARFNPQKMRNGHGQDL
jgi:hypothetical protein